MTSWVRREEKRPDLQMKPLHGLERHTQAHYYKTGGHAPHMRWINNSQSIVPWMNAGGALVGWIG